MFVLVQHGAAVTESCDSQIYVTIDLQSHSKIKAEHKLFIQFSVHIESLLADIQKKITEAFDIFDHESNKTVDDREVGTIVRSLGCCPSEAELHDILAEIMEEEPTGYIRFERFLPMMTHVLMERRYKPQPEDMLLKAFHVLDTENKGFLSQEELTKYMTEEGEPFSQEEMEEMLSAAVDPEKGTILYKDYASSMAVEET